MHRRFALVLAASAAVLVLAACSGKGDANEENFGSALSRYFERRGALCLNQFRAFPVLVTEADRKLRHTMATGLAAQLDALEVAGLVRCEAAGAGRRCALNAAAKAFARERESTRWSAEGTRKVMQTDLCWGRMVLDRVVRWEEPMKFGDYQQAEVVFTYQLADVADWARLPEVQEAFPAVRQAVAGAGIEVMEHTLKLTREGWEAKGLD